MEWILSNAGNIICIIAVLAIAGTAFAGWLRSRKSGCSCGGHCGSCTACSMHSAARKQ